MKILEKMQRENADEADIFDEASAHEGKQEAQSLDERLRGVNLGRGFLRLEKREFSDCCLTEILFA